MAHSLTFHTLKTFCLLCFCNFKLLNAQLSHFLQCDIKKHSISSTFDYTERGFNILPPAIIVKYKMTSELNHGALTWCQHE